MSSVLHPAGPEPAQTYWVRRVAVAGIAVVVLAVAGALIANGTSSGSAVQANPSPPPPAAPTAALESPTPTSKPKPSARATASAKPSAARPSATAKPTRSARATATPKPRKTPPPPPPPACAGHALRPTLTGSQRLEIKQRTTFTLSLINGSGRTCTASVNQDVFELVINSGSDRIWTTKDCASIVRPLRRTLQAEEALVWKLAWDGRRSRPGCKARPEIPRPGTYYATAITAGAEPVRLRMILRAG